MKLVKIFLIIFSAMYLIIVQKELFSIDDVIVLPKTGHRKAAISFNHKAHSEEYGTKCTDCHHKGETIKCFECHINRDQGKIINIKGAFHQQCHDCHRKTSGPKACGRCHTVAEKN